MKIYNLTRTQVIPATLAQTWDFFSDPSNLAKITPSEMNFRIIHNSGTSEIHSGQIIKYKVTVLPFYTTTWVTEIKDVDKPYCFIDQQREGPYTLWHHRHRFKAVTAGVEMTDEVNYAIPLGLLGRLAHRIFVQRQLNAIFDHRYAVLEKYFKREKQGSQLSANL